MYKIACTRAVNQPMMLKEVQMNTMSLYFDPEVLYKNNLTFHFMNFNENLRNLREREKMIINE